MTNRRHLLIVLLGLALFVSACSDDGDSAETGGGDADPGATDSTVGEGNEGEPAMGVTDDTITLGFAYLDLEPLQDIISFDHGPYAEHMQTLVDDLNASGGIHGRTVEVASVGFSPLGDESQLAACIELTDDAEAFVVLGQARGDNVLCYTDQHDTMAIIEDGMNAERLERSTAPYWTLNASEERTVTELIDLAAAEGLLEGASVAVHATELKDHDLATDVAVPALEAAGADVVYESLIGVGGTDVGAGAEAISLNIEAMRGAGVDTVFVVGEALLAGSTFAAEGFLPTLLLADISTASALGEDHDLSGFDVVYTIGNPTGSDFLDDEAFVDRCASIWDATHPDDPVIDSRLLDGEGSDHGVGLGTACRTLGVFVAAATAAGPDLDRESFRSGIESLGPFHLPGWGSASFGPDKADAFDGLVLQLYDPDDPASSSAGFVPLEN